MTDHWIQLLSRVLYNTIRATVDRRHRLKHSREFAHALAVSGDRGPDERELADLIIEVSDEFDHDPADVTDAAYHLAATGIDHELPDLLRETARLSEACDCDMPLAADGLATHLTIFDLDASEADRVRDTVQFATDRTDLTLPQVVDIVSWAGARAQMLGKDIEQLAREIVAVDRLIDPATPEFDTMIRQELIGRYDAEFEFMRDIDERDRDNSEDPP